MAKELLGPRAGEYCTGTSGNITVSAALPGGYQRLQDVLTANGDFSDGTINDPITGAWQEGVITRVSATEYSRTFKTSSSGAAVTFAANTLEVFLDVPPRKAYSIPAYGSNFNLIGGKLTGAAAAGALTIAIKTNNGNDPSKAEPVYVCFRSATGTDGAYTVMAIEAATSLVLSSDSTLGVVSSTAFRIWVVGFNDGGTFRLGAVNCLGSTVSDRNIYHLYEGLNSSTAEGGAGAADAAGVIYTGTAVAAKPMRILGFLEWDETGLTAGTWTTTDLALVSHYGAGMPKPGDTVQDLCEWTPGMTTGTTTIPFDNTPPENDEGTLFQSRTITPRSAANLLAIEVKANLANSAGGNMTATIHMDSVANALAVSSQRLAAISHPHQLTVRHRMRAQTTAEITFKNYCGSNAAGTTTFNGTAGAAKFGDDLYDSYIAIKEIMA